MQVMPAQPKRVIGKREFKRLDVQAHNQAFDELKTVKYRFLKNAPTEDLMARKKQIMRALVAKPKVAE